MQVQRSRQSQGKKQEQKQKEAPQAEGMRKGWRRCTKNWGFTNLLSFPACLSSSECLFRSCCLWESRWCRNLLEKNGEVGGGGGRWGTEIVDGVG